MLKKLYIHNYRCFQNFELSVDNDLHSYLFLGKNGSGKSSLVNVFELFKKIGQGNSQIANLVSRNDFNLIAIKQPMTISIEIELQKRLFSYTLTLDFIKQNNKTTIKSEQLTVEGSKIITRNDHTISYRDDQNDNDVSEFALDCHTIGLTVISPRHRQNTDETAIEQFKNWLGKMIVIAPIPALMNGESNIENQIMYLNHHATNISEYLNALFGEYPESYVPVVEHIKQIMPDFSRLRNQKTSETSRKIIFEFNQIDLHFENLSYGEKIFLLTSLIMASTELGQVSLCVWDEPDNYVSLVEMSHFLTNIKRTFAHSSAQFFATTHNPEAIRAFSSESTYILSRNNHHQPPRLKLLAEDKPEFDVVEMIKSGLIEL